MFDTSTEVICYIELVFVDRGDTILACYFCDGDDKDVFTSIVVVVFYTSSFLFTSLFYWFAECDDYAERLAADAMHCKNTFVFSGSEPETIFFGLTYTFICSIDYSEWMSKCKNYIFFYLLSMLAQVSIYYGNTCPNVPYFLLIDITISCIKRNGGLWRSFAESYGYGRCKGAKAAIVALQ